MEITPKLKNIKLAETIIDCQTISLFRNRKNQYTIVVFKRRRPFIMRLPSQRVAVAEYVDMVESKIQNLIS